MTGIILIVIIILAIIAEIFWFMQLLHLMKRDETDDSLWEMSDTSCMDAEVGIQVLYIVQEIIK